MDPFSDFQTSTSFDYTIVGAGPAGICAIAKLLSLKIPSNRIAWVDPQFQVGAFGTILSNGSSLPSNTTVGNFQKVNQAINEIASNIPSPSLEKQALPITQPLTITGLSSDAHCSLKVAAEPMQKISDYLIQCVQPYRGEALSLKERLMNNRRQWEINVQQDTGKLRTLISERVLLAIGAKPKPLSFHFDNMPPTIPLNIALVASDLDYYIAQQSPETAITKVAVIGSSHSAALSVMNLLKARIPVKQLMNKPYRFAQPRQTAEGLPYTQFDNTGLKGEVGSYIKALMDKTKISSDIQEIAASWESSVYTPTSPLSEEDRLYFKTALQDCSHLVVAIGYEVLSALTVNERPLNQCAYDSQTTCFFDMPGLYGLGIAFPQRVQSPSGEVEFAVGYSKFWSTVNQPQVVENWLNPILL